MTTNPPIDELGRSFRKLRISLLDACNFKCTYCMPASPEFINYNSLLGPDEIETIVSHLLGYGIEEIRLTGGEPLLRKDLIPIVQKLSKLPIKRLAMTTNAFGLERKLIDLKKAGLQSINISLDSLDRERFREITKIDGLKNILTSILKAKELDFEVKINAVSMRGTTDRELWDFVDFSAKNDIEVRFLEVMKIGVMVNKFDDYFIPAQELIDQLNSRHSLNQRQMSLDSTSFSFTLENKAKIGFIASESRPFCGNCSRLRLGAHGRLYTCLMSDYGSDIKDMNRDELGMALADLLQNKPKNRIEKIERPMNQIGG